MSEGFYKRRRGILEHIESHSIDLLESGIHDFLLLKANLVVGGKYPLPPGVCRTSAPAIHAYCPRVSVKTIQRCLKDLETLGYIKTWKIPGKRGNYPVLICRASVHDRSGNEYRINGEKTKDWRDPVIEPVGELSGSSRGIVGELSGNREVRREKGEKPTATAAKTAPLSSLGKDQSQLQNHGNGKYYLTRREAQIGGIENVPKGFGEVPECAICGRVPAWHEFPAERKRTPGDDGHAFVVRGTVQ
jgi:hypothetical protein